MLVLDITALAVKNYLQRSKFYVAKYSKNGKSHHEIVFIFPRGAIFKNYLNSINNFY